MSMRKKKFVIISNLVSINLLTEAKHNFYVYFTKAMAKAKGKTKKISSYTESRIKQLPQASCPPPKSWSAHVSTRHLPPRHTPGSHWVASRPGQLRQEVRDGVHAASLQPGSIC